MHYSALLAILVLFAAFPLSLAGVEITTPNANTVWAGGSTVEMKWRDDSNNQPLKYFGTYSIYLCWGSNDVPMCDHALGPPNSIFSLSSRSTRFLIPAAVGDNGNVYFVKMETASKMGGITVNYSSRFELTDMTGTFSATATAEQEKGDSAPPESLDTTRDAAAPKDGGAAQAAVSYTLQTGPTRYAPMQNQPGTRITAKKASRQYPTSSYTLFRTKGPRPLVQTTITQSWDYKVTSLENTATPAPHPDDPMQKFLNRWKD